MGYEIERFLGYVNDGLLCCICRDVLEHPLQAPCEHAFCTTCIHGWLVHHNNCPEDRQVLTVTDLRALHRYMRNDLSRLQIQCCPVQFERRHLDSHLAVCEHRSRECPNGCGYAILSAEDLHHNCIAELRTELELLRSEMICRVEETKQEMESRLDSQRRHMVQKESLLQAEIEELKSQMSRLLSDVRTLIASERQHRQDLEQANLEQRELIELLKGAKRDCRTKTSDASSSLPVTRLESLKRRTREVTII
ncbi:hypothetical protein GDO81_029874 [Engystomops pustulosus]|uniref:RING-type domain-containing protein n=1 Tax=Engystomops pustulosus TaxID=76066 RepID=A0AAV6Z3Z9_ENGPU|nr:hypothetical protein GDO81_029874 [Engystomops pustulosus]